MLLPLAAIDSTEELLPPRGAASAPAFAAVAAAAARAVAAVAVRREACIMSRLESEKHRSLAFPTSPLSERCGKKKQFFFSSFESVGIQRHLHFFFVPLKGLFPIGGRNGIHALRLQHEGLALPRLGLAIHRLVRELAGEFQFAR